MMTSLTAIKVDKFLLTVSQPLPLHPHIFNRQILLLHLPTVVKLCAAQRSTPSSLSL